MQEFVSKVTDRLGLDKGEAESATGGILGLLKAHGKSADFDALKSKVPGVEEMLGKAKTGGGLGGLMGSLSGMLGGKGGGAISAAGVLGSLGGKAGDFVSMLGGYLTQKAGENVVGRLFGSVPELKKLLG